MLQPDLMEAPEWALRSFEKLTGYEVVVHDLAGTLRHFLPPERFKHHAMPCAAVKATHDWACLDFELTRLRAEIDRYPEGRYHVCHAGIFEWVLPVVIQDRLALILFAGRARAKGEFQHLVRDVRTTKQPAGLTRELPEIVESQAQLVLECMRQLRARLLEWHRSASPLWEGGAQTRGPGEGIASRRLQVLSYLYHHHTGEISVKSLAGHLGLSESRTMHLVQKVFGKSYVALLNEMRLRTAAALLRGSSLPILELCLGSGFRDVSHFHRVFRKRFGVTPLQYRKLPHV